VNGVSYILIVEDDIYLRQELVNTFAKKGYRAASIDSFDTPEEEILNHKPDLLILDINLPGRSGFELCKRLKAKASFPILMLTSRDTLADELHGLELGADDYVTKPCPPDRLLARAQRLLQTYRNVRNLIQVSDIVLDVDTYKVIWRDRQVILSATEGQIFKTLIEGYPAMVPKEEVLQTVWGSVEYVDENIVRVNTTRLRKNLSSIGLDDVIQTIRGQGYKLEVQHL